MEILLSNQSKSSPVSSSKLFDFLIYSKAMAADAAVSVSFSHSATTASMSPRTKNITLPYPKSDESIRLTKAYLDHEIAHIKYPSLSEYANPSVPKRIRSLANAIDDVRIEALASRQFFGVLEDLHFLNQELYNDGSLFTDEVCKKSYESVIGTIILFYSHVQLNPTKPFNEEVFTFFQDSLYPLINECLPIPKYDILSLAEKIDALILDFLKLEESAQEPNNSGAKEEFSSEERPDPKDSLDEEAELIGFSDLDASSKDEEPFENIDVFNLSSLIKELLGDVIARDPVIKEHLRIGDFRDVIKHVKHDPLPSHIQQRGIEQQSVIASYRSIFNQLLSSTSRTFRSRSEQGIFDPKHASSLIVNPINPRSFYVNQSQRSMGYNVSILVDNSGSMSRVTYDSSKISHGSRLLLTLLTLCLLFFVLEILK